MKKPISKSELIVRTTLIALCGIAIAMLAGCASVQAKVERPDGTVVTYSSNRLLLKQDTTASMDTNGTFAASAIQEQAPDSDTVSALAGAVAAMSTK